MHENYAVLWRRIAAACPGDTAVSDGVQTLDYREFDRRAAAVAGSLRARGVGAGDRVAFCLHNTVEFLVGFYACLKLEAIPVSVNYRYRAREVAALLAVATPAVLVFSAAHRAPALEAAAATGAAGPRLLVEVAGRPGETVVPGNPSARVSQTTAGAASAAAAADGAASAVVPFEALLDAECADRADPAHRAELPDPGPGAQLYVFTGGTTGTPRAVVWEVGSLLQIQQSSIYPPVGLPVPTGLEDAVALATAPDRPRVVTLPLAPFIHATALFSAMNALALGGTVVIHPQPGLDADAVAERIVRERVTRLIVAGDAVAVPVLDALEPRAGSAGLALGSVISSGMRFSDETKRRLHRLGEVAIVDILASTEGGPYAMAVSRGEGDLPARFRLAEEAVVLDEGRRQVQDRPGATGILAFRGPLPRGYLDDPEKTAQSYPVIDGVRHASPGDYVRVLPDRCIELLGRGSSVVNTGGEKVYPAEVEQVLLGHPAVADAVVFGVADERWGEVVAAAVALEPGTWVAEEDLLAFVGGRLAGYKKPRRLSVREDLGRGPTGKLDMRVLRASLEKC